MTLDEYKCIYWMEWAHRLWGRFIGISYIVPLAYFAARGRIARRDWRRILPIGGLIAGQGALGWWMVRSGLGDELLAPGSHPRVSQYRLAAHLGTAFVTYGTMLTAGLHVLRQHRARLHPAAADAALVALRHPLVRRFAGTATALTALVFGTTVTGGFVAGLDAGLIYNDFPYMGGGERLLPPRAELLSDFYARRADGADRVWRNMLENPALVQLEHRIMAGTTFVSVIALNAWAALSPTLRARLPRTCVTTLRSVLGIACLQVTLGISTLIYLVPIPLASAHQAGSLALFTAVLVLRSRMHAPQQLARWAVMVQQTAVNGAGKTGLRTVPLRARP